MQSAQWAFSQCLYSNNKYMNEQKMDNQDHHRKENLFLNWHIEILFWSVFNMCRVEKITPSLYTSRHMAPADFETETMRMSHLELL